MFDLNTIISQALTQAVEQATKPLIERITALESQALAERVTELENRNKDKENVHDASVEVQLNRLDTRVAALEADVADAITGDQVNHLIEEALSDINWEEQVQDVLCGSMLEETINDAIDEMLSELRIARR
jgi:hypothetical protein